METRVSMWIDEKFNMAKLANRELKLIEQLSTLIKCTKMQDD